MNILGFMGWASHDPGACIIKTKTDGSFDFCAISEERLNRIKYSYHFPLRSIKYCLEALDIPSIESIDLVINDWSQHQDGFGSNYSFRKLEYDYIRKHFKTEKTNIKLIPSHHLAHAYSAFIPSGFDKAAILVVDAIGSNLQGTSLYIGTGNKITFIESSGSFSLGKLYDSITRKVLNFGVGEDGKTMGLAAFGEKYLDMPPILNIKGQYHGLSVDYSRFMRRMPDNKIMNDNIKQCDKKENLYDPYYSRVAYEVQSEIENAMLHLARYAKEKTGCLNLCISGGVGLNCVANEKIKNSGLFEKVFVQPASSDAGVPFGLALYGYYSVCDTNNSYKPVFRNAYTGRSYSDKAVEDTLDGFNIPYHKTNVKDIAKLLSEGNIIGWFTGGSEFGPRALGHRSILADPRSSEMKEIINAKVKHRELYRPFAPSILSEYASEYFNLGGHESPFMLYAPSINPDKISAIPAVSHVDGTGRVQTVSKENCEDYYSLIASFHSITGVPVVLNTSFNDNDEPIVETPLDALICFLRTNIDYLIFNTKYIIHKPEVVNSQAKVKDMVQHRENILKTEYKSLLQNFLSEYSIDNLKEFMGINQQLSDYYKNHAPYAETISFINKNRTINFVGDRYHYELALKLTKELFGERRIKEAVILEDYLENVPEAINSIEKLRNGTPLLLGFYNITEELRKFAANNADIFIPYQDFQMHLANIVSPVDPESVSLAGIESFSCEYNMTKSFEQMFESI